VTSGTLLTWGDLAVLVEVNRTVQPDSRPHRFA
jgi:hypothetical protein